METLAQVCATPYLLNVKDMLVQVLDDLPVNSFRQDIRHSCRSMGLGHPLSALREALGLFGRVIVVAARHGLVG